MKQRTILWLKLREFSFASKDGMSGMWLFFLHNYVITTLPDAVSLHWMRCYFLLLARVIWGFFTALCQERVRFVIIMHAGLITKTCFCPVKLHLSLAYYPSQWNSSQVFHNKILSSTLPSVWQMWDSLWKRKVNLTMTEVIVKYGREGRKGVEI